MDNRLIETPSIARHSGGPVHRRKRLGGMLNYGFVTNSAHRRQCRSEFTHQYRGRHLSPDIISYAVWLYARFTLSFRDVEELLAHRGIQVSYETIRRWCLRYGPYYARRLRRQSPMKGDAWMIDEVFISIKGERHYLWRAVGQDGDVIDILLQKRRNAVAAKRFFRRLLDRQKRSPNRLVTDQLGSYRVARRELLSDVPHDTPRHAKAFVAWSQVTCA